MRPSATEGKVPAGKVRLAVVGTGGVANAHAKAHLRNADLVEVVALADVVPGKAEEFAARHGLDAAKCCGHYDEILALPGVDAVDVCTRPETHAPAALAAFAAGKHVFCEKPLATSVAEARIMLDAANASGAVHMVDFTYRYYPGARFIRSLIDSGEIGEVLRVRAEYLITPPLGGWSTARRRPNPADPSANIVGDLGSHMIDLARFFGGEIERVACQYRVFGEHNESAIITGDFASGAVASLEMTSVATGRGGN
jgi:predicted dehydrogenase